MARNHQSNGADELAKEELYCRFSRRGQWHQRFRRFRQGLTWVVVIHVLLGSKRLLDFCLALILICLLSPLFARTRSRCALTVAEREEISRGLANDCSFGESPACLGEPRRPSAGRCDGMGAGRAIGQRRPMSVRGTERGAPSGADWRPNPRCVAW